MTPSTREAAARVFRDHSGRVLATLIRQLGDFDRAEDALQDALTRALETWPEAGIPDEPAAWLITTARNKAIDRLRRESNFAAKQNEIRMTVERSTPAPDDENDSDIADDQLKLMFTACRDPLCIFDRFVEILAFENVEPPELFLGLRKRTIDRRGLAVAHLNGRGRGDALERLAKLEHAVFLDLVGEGEIGPHIVVELFCAGFRLLGLVGINQHRILHVVSPFIPFILETNEILLDRPSRHGVQ